MTAQRENTIFEQLLLALQHLSALNELAAQKSPGDFARIAVLAWYYGIYSAASAMVAAQSGSFQEDHAGTARVWDDQISKQGLAMSVFDWRVSSLLKPVRTTEVEAYKNNSKGDLQTKPTNGADARGAAAQYLSGTAEWSAKKIETDLLEGKLKALGLTNFRKTAAKLARDQRFGKRPVGFLHQASRYRGKANYREALYLSYGATTQAKMVGFIDDMSTVLEAFVAMAGAFAERKLKQSTWDDFVSDLEAKRAFSLSPKVVWA